MLADDRPNLEQAGLRGLLRVVGAEYPQLRPSQIDVDDDVDAKLLARVLLSGSEEDETAFRNGEWYTAHLHPSPLRPDERYTTVVDHSRDGMRLEIRTPGDMQTLELAAFDRIPPGPGQIEVAVTASSLNFADVLLAFGRYPSFEGLHPQLGIDFAGVVTAVGPQVTSHRVGDHVGGMSPNGCWGTFVTCDADVAVTLPAGLRDDQAAAVSTASATAWYSLHDLARIKSGDKVLIHSATGGVGQAAIAIARAAGAEIFATAGTEERRDILRDMGITHVYDSRSAAFAEQIRRDTDGYGVDIVLNSLTGAAQRAGVELLAFGGRFVEIGKKDIYGDTRLGLFPFRRNLSFYGVDLALMATTHPEQIRDLLSTVYRLTAEGVLPQPETTHYPLADAATAIRVMGAAEHTGKLLLSVPKVGHSNVVVPPEQAKVFRRDGSYIITGGLGGLGLFLASKMAGAGCGRIVLNSRSEPKAEALAEIARMRAAGTEVEVVSGDIALSETVDRLVAVATATGLAGARCAARRRGRRGRHPDQYQRRADRSGLGSEGLRRLAPAPGHHGTAAGLVLLVLLGGRPDGLAGTGRLRRGQQLAGRVHPLAPFAGAARHRGRVGGMGRDRRGQASGRRRRHRDDQPGRGRACLRGAAASRSRLQRLRADHRYAVADRSGRAQPVRRGVPSQWRPAGGHQQLPGGTA